MPRRKIVRNSDLPYSISARCNNRDWFDIPIEHVWNVFTKYLYFISFAYEVEIHAFVLMNNHYHLLLKTPLANIDEAMEYFQRETSKQISRENNRINHLYGGPYYASLIKDVNHYNNAYKYILRNPVRAGLCKDVLEYPFSSLRGILGFQRLEFPVFANEELFSDLENTLKWLNEPVSHDVDDIIRKGLRRSIFCTSRSQNTGKKIELPESFKI